jgi:hypothetical protein
MFGFFLAALSLAPLGVFLAFWRMFPRDRGNHPIYRESGIDTIDKKPKSLTRPWKPPIREVKRDGKVA